MLVFSCTAHTAPVVPFMTFFLSHTEIHVFTLTTSFTQKVSPYLWPYEEQFDLLTIELRVVARLVVFLLCLLGHSVPGKAGHWGRHTEEPRVLLLASSGWVWQDRRIACLLLYRCKKGESTMWCKEGFVDSRTGRLRGMGAILSLCQEAVAPVKEHMRQWRWERTSQWPTEITSTPRPKVMQ